MWEKAGLASLGRLSGLVAPAGSGGGDLVPEVGGWWLASILTTPQCRVTAPTGRRGCSGSPGNQGQSAVAGWLLGSVGPLRAVG